MSTHIVGIGPNCYCARMLNGCGLRTVALPFDHNLSSLQIVQHAIQDRFHIFLDPEQWAQTPFSRQSTHHNFYQDMLVTPTLEAHVKVMLENPMRKYLANMTDLKAIDMFFHYDMINNKTHVEQMQRRCARFLNMWDSDDVIVLVYFNEYVDDSHELVAFAKSISRAKTFVVGVYPNNKCAAADNETVHFVHDTNALEASISGLTERSPV